MLLFLKIEQILQFQKANPFLCILSVQQTLIFTIPYKTEKLFN
jgi:hypothetical protein